MSEAEQQKRRRLFLVLTAVGLFALVMVSRPLTTARKWLIWSMADLFVLVLIWSFAREFYALELPRAVVVLAAIGVSALTGGVMYLGLRTSRWVQQAPGWIQQAPELFDQAPEAIREPLEAAGVRRLASWLSRRANGGETPKPALIAKSSVALTMRPMNDVYELPPHPKTATSAPASTFRTTCAAMHQLAGGASLRSWKSPTAS